jgi:hypothetical protein
MKIALSRLATLGEVADVLRDEFGVYRAALVLQELVKVRDARRLDVERVGQRSPRLRKFGLAKRSCERRWSSSARGEEMSKGFRPGDALQHRDSPAPIR